MTLPMLIPTLHVMVSFQLPLPHSQFLESTSQRLRSRAKRGHEPESKLRMEMSIRRTTFSRREKTRLRGGLRVWVWFRPWTAPAPVTVVRHETWGWSWWSHETVGTRSGDGIPPRSLLTRVHGRCYNCRCKHGIGQGNSIECISDVYEPEGPIQVTKAEGPQTKLTTTCPLPNVKVAGPTMKITRRLA
ncbi:hypothetical protein GALMADRAFT_1292835 [Galerina marginata CBS 339.88]|uniref:Uncharacterized protein n=1 Tax=Galerina marginata (strain CBS 339.88) TaxID=685588 RepID=A0A067T3Y3_GALM3|nr:hypothetical protein GALMADRAFT_1292835 [Galerina marginata CBS 339.88]